MGQGVEQISAASGTLLQPLVNLGLTMLFGLVAGGLAVLGITLMQRLKAKIL